MAWDCANKSKLKNVGCSLSPYFRTFYILTPDPPRWRPDMLYIYIYINRSEGGCPNGICDPWAWWEWGLEVWGNSSAAVAAAVAAPKVGLLVKTASFVLWHIAELWIFWLRHMKATVEAVFFYFNKIAETSCCFQKNLPRARLRPTYGGRPSPMGPLRPWAHSGPRAHFLYNLYNILYKMIYLYIM